MSLKVYAFTCGHLTGELAHLMEGGEGDVSAVDWDDQFTDFQTHGAVDPQTITLDLNVLATARARVGWANNDQLYYLTGGVGFRYDIQTSSDLKTWTPWITVTNTNRTMSLLDPNAASANHKFYRAVVP